MANLHVRSNSLPTKSHPVIDSIQEHLQRLKSSISADSLCLNLASIIVLHEGVNNMIQMLSSQQALNNANHTNDLLDESLELVDLCGFTRDVLSATKESVQLFECSVRRNRGATFTDCMDAFTTSRKKNCKMVKKFIKNFKKFDKMSAVLFNKESDDHKEVVRTLKETEACDFLLMKNVLIFLSGEIVRSKERSWDFLSKFTQKEFCAFGERSRIRG